jgi:hypothetical protein
MIGGDVVQNLIGIYPFNLARAIFQSEEDALKIYLPGLSLALATLNEREQDVLKRRFSEKLTLRAVGKIHGLTQERARQIEAKALRKLRMPSLKNMFVAVPLTEIKEQNIEYQKLSREHELLATAFEMLTAKKADPEVVVPLAEMAVTMQTPISDLDLSVRSFNCLKRAGKNTLRDIVEMTEDDLLQIRNLGRKSAEEIIGKIKSYGLDLSK